jgi:hypothetical protein
LPQYLEYHDVEIQVVDGVAEKHDFRDIQRKIPQISDFAEKQDLNPPPHGDTAGDIAKMFAKFFLRKSDFGSKNTIFAKIRSDFREIPQTTYITKIGFREKLFSRFSRFFQFSRTSANIRFSLFVCIYV